MNRGLSVFFNHDRKARMAVFYSAAGAMALSGFIADVSGTYVPLAIAISLAIGAAVYFYFLYQYKEGAKLTKKVAIKFRFQQSNVPFGTLATASILLVAFVGASSSTVGAAIINWRLKTIDKKLSTNAAQSASELHDLTSTIAIARRRKILIDSDVEGELKSKLVRMDTNLPGFWPAAAELINYQSGIVKEPMDCAQTVPEHLTWAQVDHLESRGVPPPDQVKFQNCILDLDSPIPAELISTTQTDALSFVCQNCQVIYSGRSIPLFELRTSVHAILENCSFRVAASADSSRHGKGLIISILRSKDLLNVTYVNSIAQGNDFTVK